MFNKFLKLFNNTSNNIHPTEIPEKVFVKIDGRNYEKSFIDEYGDDYRKWPTPQMLEHYWSITPMEEPDLEGLAKFEEENREKFEEEVKNDYELNNVRGSEAENLLKNLKNEASRRITFCIRNGINNSFDFEYKLIISKISFLSTSIYTEKSDRERSVRFELFFKNKPKNKEILEYILKEFEYLFVTTRSLSDLIALRNISDVSELKEKYKQIEDSKDPTDIELAKVLRSQILDYYVIQAFIPFENHDNRNVLKILDDYLNEIHKAADKVRIEEKTDTDKKIFLFFDTETSGLPKDWNAPPQNIFNWPRLVQLAYIGCDNYGNILFENSHIIRPQNFVISPNSSKVHGITNEIALEKGENLEDVLQIFNRHISNSTTIVAHNLNFDLKVIMAEFYRLNMTSSIQEKKRICTMLSATNYCQIPGEFGFKWPKLQELHLKLFQTEFQNAHDALIDVRATLKCFWELKNRNILKIV